MTAATCERPAVRHQEAMLPMLDYRTTFPAFGDSRLPAHFWSKVRVGSVPAYRPDLGPCWDWIACCNSKGYGRFSVGRRGVNAHRFAYEHLVGLIPDGLECDHLCRKHACVNPLHIEPVSRAENVLRSPERRAGGVVRGAQQKAKTHCPAGHPYDENNTYLRKHGGRTCKMCQNIRLRRYRSRQSSKASDCGGKVNMTTKRVDD